MPQRPFKWLLGRSLFLWISDGLHALGGAGANAGASAGTLVGINASQRFTHGNRTFGTDLAALGTADTTGLTNIHDGLTHLGVGAAIEDLLVLGNHVDHVLGTGLLAQTAADAQLLIHTGIGKALVVGNHFDC